MPQDTQNLSYEEALSRLNTLIEAMENGDTPLTQMVDTYAEGRTLLKICQERLQAAELKIEHIHTQSGELKAEPFQSEADA